MAGAEEKEPENIVHRNAIFCETIHKEQRDQKLYTSYGVNPYKKSKPTCAQCVAPSNISHSSSNSTISARCSWKAKLPSRFSRRSRRR